MTLSTWESDFSVIAFIRPNKPMNRKAGNYRAIGFFVSLFVR